jgi:hypothetical protein
MRRIGGDVKLIHRSLATIAALTMIAAGNVSSQVVSTVEQQSLFDRSRHSSFPGGIYEVDFTRAILAPTVRAEVRIQDGRLFMAGWGADMHKRGWANYVRNLRALEMSGSEAGLKAIADSAAWRLVDPTPRMLRIEYQVDLSYATTQWPYGNEQAATLQGQDLYTVSKSIFIVSSATSAREVVYRVRTGWHVTTPWPAGPHGIYSYVVEDTESLIDNSFVVGPTAPAVARAGRFTFLLHWAPPGQTEIGSRPRFKVS